MPDFHANPIPLDRVPLFQDLLPQQIAQLSQLIHPSTVPARTILFTAGQPRALTYLVLAGTLKIQVEQADGRNVILAIRGRGELVGEMSLIEQRAYSATVVTLERAVLGWIHQAAFEACLRSMPELSYNLARLLSERLRLAAEQIQALASLDLFGRIARQLLAFAQAYGEPTSSGAIVIGIRLTQNDLAEMVGATRVYVNRAICAYKQQGYLSIGADYRIILHNPAALARHCNKDY